MTRIKIKELVWSESNIEHVKKHRASIFEIEEAAKNYIVHRRGKFGRYLLFGRSGTRILTVVVFRVGMGTYQLVTSRDSDKNERRRVYEKEKHK